MKRAVRGSKRNRGLQLYLWGILYTPKDFPPRLSLLTFLNRKDAVAMAQKMRFFDGVEKAKSVRLIAKMKDAA